MGQKWFPPKVSHGIMFQSLAQSDKEIQSYPSAKEGTEMGH